MKKESELHDVLKTLSDEELAKIPPLTEKDIREALEEGRKERLAVEKKMHPPPRRNLRYR
jgi:hypothetical protein